MKIASSLALLAVLIAGVLSEDTTKVSSIDTTTSVPTTAPNNTTQHVTTSTEPITSSSSPVPTTTSPVTTSSPAPPTTKVLPTTSTPLPTTSSSTVAPTTQEPGTSTVSPVPPVPDVGSWNVTDLNTTCIRVDLKIRFKISVKDHDDYIVLSPNAVSSGDCNATNGTQVLTLTDLDNIFTITFDKDSTYSFVKEVSLQYTTADGTGHVSNDSHLFPVKIGNSYLCTSLDNVNLVNVTMEIFSIHLQSYGSAGNKDFGAAEECEADNKVSDIVPIAVGIALLALVVVVLIAYFVGRRRSRQQGYQSV